MTNPYRTEAGALFRLECPNYHQLRAAVPAQHAFGKSDALTEYHCME